MVHSKLHARTACIDGLPFGQVLKEGFAIETLGLASKSRIIRIPPFVHTPDIFEFLGLACNFEQTVR